MKKSPTLFITFLMSTWLYSQSPTTLDLSLNHLAISVTDIDRSSAFYKEILNFTEITNRSKLEGVRWFDIGNGMELHLISIIKEPIALNKALHIAFTTTEFDAVIKKLDKAGIEYSDWPGTPNKINMRADGVQQIFFQDPDEYWIEVNSVGVK